MFFRQSFFRVFVLMVIAMGLGGCTTLVTAPVSVASSVVEAGFGIVGAAGGAVVNTVTGGGSDEQ